ncbi:MAG TPA: ATP-binding protein [Candidatus Mediterraneibacter intestinavium]|nr:ATP-binding protein [Candidatus Mediterraneibacter intestinavium]
MGGNKILIGYLESGEAVALQALEISSVPDISIIDSNADETAVIDGYKKDMGNLLSEIYQNYKAQCGVTGQNQDVSLELLWTTEEVVNQPYRAKIRLFLIVRAIGRTPGEASEMTFPVMTALRSTLDLQKYEYRDMDEEELMGCVRAVDDSAVKALVKEETLENLQNQMIPVCYAYDRIPDSGQDLSRIVNSLIDHPGCAVSFQLIPAWLDGNEINELSRMMQLLDTLSKGAVETGNMSFALAEKHAETYRYYTDQKNSALFLYNILIYGNPEAVSNLSSRVYAQINSSDENVNMRFEDLRGDEIRKDANFYPLPWAVNELLMNMDRNMQIWNSGMFSNAYYRLPYIITAEEASQFFRLPVGGSRVSAGLPVNEAGKTNRTYADNIINAGDIEIGTLKSSSRGDKIGISLKDLAKHMLVVGTPGSGKTTFSVSLLDRLWKDHHIPFLVIEPAKNEYRALVQSIPDLQVFTPGKNFISPFVYNPFVPPKNVKLETYKSTLKTAFAAGVSMTTPLDKIFEEAINNCYSDFRWLDTYTSDDKGRIFNITDFVKCFQETFDAIGYTGDAKNIGRAGVVRLNSLVNLFDNYYSIPIEDLLSKPTIIELAAIENSDQKALIISLLLLSILAYVNSNYVGEGGLRNVILLEEAHVLLDADTNAGQGDANPSAIAQGLVKRMLAEIRSYGVGIVIADQSPRKVSTDVVALTDIKLAFRLVEATDKQILADSANMDEVQVKRLAKLKPGEAFFFFNKLEEPEEIKTEDYRLQNNISITLSDDGIRELSTYWKERQDKLRPYPECECVRYCQKTCDYGRRMLAKEVARRIFNRYFKADTKDFEVIRKVIPKLKSLTKAELNDEVLDNELVACVKVQLFRKIKYGTKIKIHDVTIRDNLKKA